MEMGPITVGHVTCHSLRPKANSNQIAVGPAGSHQLKKTASNEEAMILLACIEQRLSVRVAILTLDMFFLTDRHPQMNVFV